MAQLGSQTVHPNSDERFRISDQASRHGGRDHLGILGDIISAQPGDFVGIGSDDFAERAMKDEQILAYLNNLSGDEMIEQVILPRYGRFARSPGSTSLITSALATPYRRNTVGSK
jgi:hypothetical protein